MSKKMDSALSHFGPDGQPRMVDISEKQPTTRMAVATGFVRMNAKALAHAKERAVEKGDPIAIAEVAGVMGAKRTADLIPLCHPLPLTSVNIESIVDDVENGVRITAQVKTTGRTGVEMEALTAVLIACLALYDMLKAVDRSMTIERVCLLEKAGGASGDYKRAPESQHGKL